VTIRRERIYSQEETYLIYRLRKDTIGNCKKKCQDGWISDLPAFLKNDVLCCDCRKIFIYLKELVYSRIPREYWHLKLSDLLLKPPHVKLLFLKYLKNFDNAVDKGLGLGFIGSNGVGKTSLLCELGKEAIINGYGIIYVTTQDYMEYKMNGDDYNINRIEESDIILLDEIDKPYRKKGSDYVLSTLENFFRNNLPKNKVIHIATNWQEREIKEELGDSVYSIILRKLKLLHILGEDMSKKINDEWENKLVGSKVNYLDEYFVKKAGRMKRFKNGNRKS